MHLLSDPQVWLSFLTLAVLEVVLGFDNLILLAILIERLPKAERRRARYLGLGFAMLTRIALLFSIVWLARLHRSLFTVSGFEVSGRTLILLAGGLFLIINSGMEIREMMRGTVRSHKPGLMNSFWLIILQIGIIDIVFSLDTVFTAIGLSQHVEVMVAAIVVSVLVMMGVSSAMSAFIDRHPTIKMLALAFLALIGAALIGQAFDLNIPQGYLYFAMVFSAAVEWLNIHLRRRIKS